MKTDRYLMVFAAMLAASLAWSVHAAETATVKRGKINVRGQASLKGETITQLSQGESVSILEEIKVASPKKGEPAVWAKIQLPSNTPVWVFAPYIDANKAVNINRLNVRGGPGENFSVLGRLERGAVVKQIRTVDQWMEIEPPTNCVAYVALDLLEKATAVAAAPEPAPTTQTKPEPKPEPAPTTVETVHAEPPVAAANDKPVVEPKPEPVVETPAAAVPAAIPPESAASTVPMVEPAPEPAPAPKRVVIREGRVVYSRSIQAPTTYALESLETRRIINYLHTEQTGLKLKSFAGRKVMVTGEELLDARWAYTPILEVEDISIAR